MTNQILVLPVKTVKQVLSNLGGKFVTITAIKKDGKLTVINGQMADSPPSHANHSELVSLKKGGKDNGYRTANIKKITRIAFDGNVLAKAG